jgi:hypothetical protein
MYTCMQVIYYLLVNSGLLDSSELAAYQSTDEAYFSKKYDIPPQQLIAAAGVDIMLLADQYTALQSFTDVQVDTAVLTPENCDVFDVGFVVIDLQIKVHAVDGIGAVLKNDRGAVIIEQIKQPHQLTQQQPEQPPEQPQQQQADDTAAVVDTAIDDDTTVKPTLTVTKSPAEEAGLMQGDIITSIGDHIVVDVQEANSYIKNCSAATSGEHIGIQVTRRIPMTIPNDGLPNRDVQPFNYLCAALLESGSLLEHPFSLGENWLQDKRLAWRRLVLQADTARYVLHILHMKLTDSDIAIFHSNYRLAYCFNAYIMYAYLVLYCMIQGSWHSIVTVRSSIM